MIAEVSDLNPLRVLWNALYTMLETLTGIVGLTPPQAGLIALAIVGLSVGWGIVGAMRGRTPFTLDED